MPEKGGRSDRYLQLFYSRVSGLLSEIQEMLYKVWKQEGIGRDIRFIAIIPAAWVIYRSIA